MNNFEAVFKTIKENCQTAGVLSADCFAEITKLALSSTQFLSVYSYLEVLEGIGLIQFCKQTNRVAITRKGMETENLFTFTNEEQELLNKVLSSKKAI